MKSQADCDSFFDCWIYNLANMKQMKEISFKDRDAIFGRLEELASRGNMSKEERAQYDYEWKIYNDYLNTFNSAEKKGRAEGRAEEKLEMINEFERLANMAGLVRVTKSAGAAAESVDMFVATTRDGILKEL